MAAKSPTHLYAVLQKQILDFAVLLGPQATVTHLGKKYVIVTNRSNLKRYVLQIGYTPEQYRNLFNFCFQRKIFIAFRDPNNFKDRGQDLITVRVPKDDARWCEILPIMTATSYRQMFFF